MCTFSIASRRRRMFDDGKGGQPANLETTSFPAEKPRLLFRFCGFAQKRKSLRESA
jgi:hypothetical protein